MRKSHKIDLFGYKASVYEEMRGKLASLMGGLLPDGAMTIPVSAACGDNVVERSPHTGWYGGPTLFECMEGLKMSDSLSGGPLRLPVQGLYKNGDGGQVIVAGRVESGTLQAGQAIQFAVSGETGNVKKVLSAWGDGRAAKVGDNIGIVCDWQLNSVDRGDVCCAREAVAIPKSEVEAHTILLEPVSGPVIAECATAWTECEIIRHADTEIGEVGEVMLRFKTPMVVERGRSSLSRLALKQRGKIIGVAVVTT